MNELELFFENNQDKLMNKWKHYFDIYDRYFHSFKGKPVTIVEIGCFHGGSLQMWKKYFGEKAIIWGIDIDPRCKSLEEENINILIGSQEDKAFLQSAIEQIGEIDILNSIHFYDSIIVIEKKEKTIPFSKMTGTPSFTQSIQKKNIIEKIQMHFLISVNKLLQKMNLPGICVNKLLELSSKN